MARKTTRRVLVYAEQDKEAADALAKAIGGTLHHRVITGSPARWQGEADVSVSKATSVTVLATPWLLATGYPLCSELSDLVKHGGVRLVTLVGAACPWADTPLAWTLVTTDPAAAAEATTAKVPPELETPAHPTVDIDDADHKRLAVRLDALYSLGPTPELSAVTNALRHGPTLRAGEILGDGRWRLLCRGKDGAVTETWRAAERGTGRLVALQVLHGHLTRDPKNIERFYAAASSAAVLDHPGFPDTLQERGDANGFPFFVTSWPEGIDLQRAVVEQGLPADAVVQTVVEVADALEHAHRMQVVHGSLEPQNIIMSALGPVQLTELGLSDESSRMGSMFTAPEAMDGTLTPAADVYALGMVLLFGLNGAPGLPAWVMRSPDRLVDKLDTDDAIKDILRACLEWDPEARPASALDVADRLLADDDRLERLATEAATQGRSTLAARLLSRLAARRPSRTIQVALAKAQLASGDDAAAADTLLELVNDPQTDAAIASDALQTLEDIADRSGDYTPLIQALEHRANEGVAAGTATLRLARLQAAHSDDPSAVSSAWLTAYQHHDTRAQAIEALEALTALAEAAEDWPALVSALRDLAPLTEGEARGELQNRLGRRYLDKLDDPQNALLWLERAAASGCQDPDLAPTLERIQASRGEWQRVITLLRAEAKGLPPARAADTLRKAARLALWATDDRSTAEELYTQVCGHKPDDTEALRFLAHHRTTLGDAAAALPHWQTLAEVSDAPASDSIGLAQALLALDRVDEASERLSTLVQAQPNQVVALSLLLELQLEAGQFEPAQHTASQLLTLHASSTASAQQHKALTTLLRLALTHKRWPQAESHARSLIALHPDSPEGWWGVARVAMAAQRKKTAPWLDATPPRITPQEALARLLLSLGGHKRLISWLSLDPLGAHLLTAVGKRDKAGLADATIALLHRRGLIGPDLFRRMLERCPGFASRINAVRMLWCEPHADTSFPVGESYRWSDAMPVFPANHHRYSVHASPLCTTDVLAPPNPSLLGLWSNDAWELLIPELSEAPTDAPADEELPKPPPPRRRVALVYSLAGSRGVLPIDEDAVVTIGPEPADLVVPDLGSTLRLTLVGPHLYLLSEGVVTIGGQPAPAELRLRDDSSFQAGPLAARVARYLDQDELEGVGGPPPAISAPMVLDDDVTLMEDADSAESNALPRGVLVYTSKGIEVVHALVLPTTHIGGDGAQLLPQVNHRLHLHRRADGFWLEDPGLEDTLGQRKLVNGEVFHHDDIGFRFYDIDKPGDDVELTLVELPEPEMVEVPQLRRTDGEIFPLVDDDFTIGRGRLNNLQIKNDGKVSRFHCKLVRRDDGWHVEDKGSSNGTYVNSTEIHGLVQLEVGDILKVGGNTFTFEFESGDELDRDNTEVAAIPKPTDPVGLETGLARIKIANQALRTIIGALDEARGAGCGQIDLQLVLQAAPRPFSTLFEQVKLTPEGLPEMGVIYNLVQRPSAERRKVLNQGLLHVIDEGISRACDALPEDQVDSFLESIARIDYRGQLRR